MKAYKGFDKELKCRDFQYEVGKEYEETKADLCSCGFHACVNPLDVFNYYEPASSRYCEVEMDEVSPELRDDSKRCSKKIRIGVEIGIKGIVEAGVKFIMDKIDWANAKETNTGHQSAATNTGDRSAATNTGHRSAATNTGYQSAAVVEGKESVAIATGVESRAKGSLGCYIVLAEWYQDEAHDWHIKHVESAKVDGEKIKADTFYTLKNGEFVEVE
jgi:hypothetical protein